MTGEFRGPSQTHHKMLVPKRLFGSVRAESRRQASRLRCSWSFAARRTQEVHLWWELCRKPQNTTRIRCDAGAKGPKAEGVSSSHIRACGGEAVDGGEGGKSQKRLAHSACPPLSRGSRHIIGVRPAGALVAAKTKKNPGALQAD